MTTSDKTRAPDGFDPGVLDNMSELDEMYDAWRTVGQALRLAAVPATHRDRARQTIPRLLQLSGLADVSRRCDEVGREARELLRAAAGPDGADRGPGRLFEAAVMRDDLESVAHALGAVRVHATGAERTLRQEADTVEGQLLRIQADVDRAAEEQMDRLWQVRRRASGPAPAILADRLSRSGANPWWLELADPLLAGDAVQQPGGDILPTRLAAASLAGEPTSSTLPGAGQARLFLEGGMVLTVHRSAHNEVKVYLEDASGTLAPGEAELVWDGEEGEASVGLSRFKEGVYEGPGTCPEELLDATVFMIRQGSRTFLLRGHARDE